MYLTDRIDKWVTSEDGADNSPSREPLTHLSCIAFLAPTHQSVEWIKQELASPRYGGYWLCKA